MQLICILISKQETNQLIQLCLSLSSLSSLSHMYHPSILPSNSGLYDFSHFLLVCSNHPSICPPSNHFLFYSLSQLKVEPLYRYPPWTLLSHTHTYKHTDAETDDQMTVSVMYEADWNSEEQHSPKSSRFSFPSPISHQRGTYDSWLFLLSE